MKVGDKINYLTLIEKLGTRKGKGWGKFLCDCGNIKEIRIDLVTTNNTKACGCKKFTDRGTGNLKYGICHTRPYHIWEKIKQRCYNLLLFYFDIN